MAAGLAVIAAVAAAAAAARTLSVGGEAPPADSAVCAAPVEVVDESGEPILGCAAQAELDVCGRLAAGDRVRLAPGRCIAERHGMSPAMRLLAGLPLDLNRAGEVDLELLVGIGPRLAERIVEDREANGPFGAVEELTRVRGVGPATLEKLRPWLQVYRVQGLDSSGKESIYAP